MKKGITLLLLAAGLSWVGNSCRSSGEASEQASYTADIVIYGGTSAAVIAAVQAAKMDKDVVVVSPARHLGGMSSSGLGWTDTGDKSVIGGLAREFYHRLYLHYQKEESWKWQEKEAYGNRGQGSAAIDGEERTMWIFEPHAAEMVFDQLIRENHIRVYRDEWLDRENGIINENGTIRFIRTLSGKAFRGTVFIDATYEGDLMAAAGVSYTVGREGCQVYGEKWNGVQTGVLHHHHYFESDISPYVMTENHVLGRENVDRSIGMGSYTMDSHNTQRYIKPDGFVQNEGDIGVKPPEPYRIDMRSILPVRAQCSNLLVPVCLSCSHIAFGSIRMEPVFMILGQSAATLAAMAIEEKKEIHELPYEELRIRLLEDGQVLEIEK